MPSDEPRFRKSRRLDLEALRPGANAANGKPLHRSTHAERAVLLEMIELDRRLRELEARQRAARRAIEEELRREHWGHLPDGWHERPDD